MVPNKRKQASRISVDSECLFLDDTLLYGLVKYNLLYYVWSGCQYISPVLH